MISTQEAYRDDDLPETTDTAVVDKVETKAETETAAEPTTVEEVKEEVKEPASEAPKENTEDSAGKKTYTAQEKINYSFSKMKKKHAAEIEALNKTIAEQQKIIDQFNAKSRDSYASEDEYLDAKLDARDAQRELARQKAEAVRMTERQQSEAMRERVTKLYPTEALQQVYTEACQLGEKNGALQAMMEDSVVKKYIFESDKSPLLVEAFCRKPSILQNILDTSDNRKPLAMYDLEQKLLRLIETTAAKASNPQTQSSQTNNAASPIPVVGKVANNGTNKSAPSDGWASEKELFKFARS